MNSGYGCCKQPQLCVAVEPDDSCCTSSLLFLSLTGGEAGTTVDMQTDAQGRLYIHSQLPVEVEIKLVYQSPETKICWLLLMSDEVLQGPTTVCESSSSSFTYTEPCQLFHPASSLRAMLCITSPGCSFIFTLCLNPAWDICCISLPHFLLFFYYRYLIKAENAPKIMISIKKMSNHSFKVRLGHMTYHQDGHEGTLQESSQHITRVMFIIRHPGQSREH